LPPTVTRFAPSPTGYLHLGHAYSALFAKRAATDHGGRFLLRIEDIDVSRCRPEYFDAIFEDLAWLGLEWEQPVRRQSGHMADYRAALDALETEDLIYPCFCSRKEIRAEIASSGAAPHINPDGMTGPIYPGTCRNLSADERQTRISSGDAYALRLDMESAKGRVGDLIWRDLDAGKVTATPEVFGDAVLARKDEPTSYHLSVVLDDHSQGITLVTRGEDLRSATHLHRLLQSLLRLDTPDYQFHKLLSGEDGRRFAKRNNSVALRTLREAGSAVADVLAKMRHLAGE